MESNMRLWKAVIICLLISPFLACTEYKQKTGPEITSLAYIKQSNMGSNLTSLAYKVTKTTITYKILVKELGQSKTDKLIATELNKSIDKHQTQWNENLAQAYQQHLNKSELNSLYYNGKRSPYYKKQMSLQVKIANSMKVLSDSLLNTVVREALSKAFEKMK